jgi:hypothetical protein
LCNTCYYRKKRCTIKLYDKEKKIEEKGYAPGINDKMVKAKSIFSFF